MTEWSIMKCPFCKQENDKVIDSRSANEGTSIRRRRECTDCGKRYTTYERLEETPIYVIKKDKTRELYSRQKILGGVRKACEKRPIPGQTQEKIAEDLERMLREKYDKEVPASVLGEFVMKQLAAIDQVAYVRFASVYRNFQDLGDFKKELRTLAPVKP